MTKKKDNNDHDSETKSSDDLRADLGETRERVSSDVHALTNKLSPENLKAEAKQAVARTWDEGRERVRDKLQQGTERVRETFESTEGDIIGFVRENPVPLTLIGAGIGLLFWNSRQARGRRRPPDPALYGRSAVYSGADGEDERGLTRDVTRQLGHLQDRVRSGFANVQHAATDTAGKAREQLEELEHQAGEQAQRAKAFAERTLEDQPLVLGALAVGVGMAVGLSIPATESEQQLVGQYRDQLFGAVGREARQLEGVAKRALDNAQDELA
jgi:ElaB/YqjD/DUF883 family membrane-anchored ribosome-binding protein